MKLRESETPNEAEDQMMEDGATGQVRRGAWRGGRNPYSPSEDEELRQVNYAQSNPWARGISSIKSRECVSTKGRSLRKEMMCGPHGQDADGESHQ